MCLVMKTYHLKRILTSLGEYRAVLAARELKNIIINKPRSRYAKKKRAEVERNIKIVKKWLTKNGGAVE